MSDQGRPLASIVIPVYDEVFLTRVCLTSLSHADLGSAEIVVVDNGSSDSTPEFVEDWAQGGPRRKYVRSTENLGFARGCNLGARESSGKFLVFLNNDTFVLPDWLPRLLEPFSDPSVWITGSRLLYPNGRVQHAGVVFIDDGPGHVFAGLPGDSPLVLQRREYQAVTAASLAIRREAFDLVGGFDTRYRNSYEDSDLCLKVRAAGGRIIYQPDSVAYHWESMSKGRLSANDLRNRELFLERWQGRFESDYDRIMGQAAADGYDLSDRLPSRREQHDQQVRLENSAAEIAELTRRVRALTIERDTLRLMIDARLLRGARWVARKGRRALHLSKRAARKAQHPFAVGRREQGLADAGPHDSDATAGAAVVPPTGDGAEHSFRMQPDGASGYVQEILRRGWPLDRSHEANVMLHVVRELNRGAFLDVGAGTGFFSLLAAAIAPHAEIHAFESDPSLRSILAGNLARNPPLNARVRVVVHDAWVSPQAIGQIDLDAYLEGCPSTPVTALRIGSPWMVGPAMSRVSHALRRYRPIVIAPGDRPLEPGVHSTTKRLAYSVIDCGRLRLFTPRERADHWQAVVRTPTTNRSWPPDPGPERASA